MRIFSCSAFFSALVVALGASFIAGNAKAATKTRTTYTNPAGICQAALPAFEGAIRKRPLAVQNEGDTNAFITCSFTSQGLNIKKVTVLFASNDGASHDISCAGVSGRNTGDNQYIVKSTTLPANGTQSPLTWNPEDFENPSSVFVTALFNISCNLLPGVGINDSEFVFSESVGA